MGYVVDDDFYKKYEKLIYKICHKYYYGVNIATRGLFDIDDMAQQVWLEIISKSDKYDSSKSEIVTFIGMVASQTCMITTRKFNTIRCGKNIKLASLEYELSQDDDKLTVEDTIGINTDYDSNMIIDRHIVLVFRLLKASNVKKIRVYYYKNMLGYTQAQCASMFGITASYISRITNFIYKRIEKALKDTEYIITDEDKVFLELVNNDLVKEIDIAKLYNVDISIIKVVRYMLVYKTCY